MSLLSVMTEDLAVVAGYATISRDMWNYEMDKRQAFDDNATTKGEAMPKTGLASFRRTTVEEWSDEWDDVSIEVSRFTRSDLDEPITYDIRGRNMTVNDLRQAAAWILNLTDDLPE